ncbi:MAG: hypothetical protein ACXWB9_08930 [Flavisolibacter sp.]
MDKFLMALDLKTLKVLHDREASKLKNALINGASWEDLQDQRSLVTEITIVIHQKRMSSFNPAESSSRNG